MIVIADDITGAAEIAGIAYAQGQQVRLLCHDGSVGCKDMAASETTVMATDMRSMSEAEAVIETRHIIRLLSLNEDGGRFLFKKTDSALRGHVVAELSTLMQATGYQRAVYLPANPSKGRIVRNGIYYINNTPIHETAFSYDPEFPACTSVLKERFPDAAGKGIIMPDAQSEEDIRKVIEAYNDGKTIFAGAADLFSALLANYGDSPHILRHATITGGSPHDSLILCGSTQSKALDLGIPVAQMPREIYDGSDDLRFWDTSAYAEQHSLILSIPYAHRTGKEVAVHLRTMMAEKARLLVTEHCPKHLMIEGGATAWATLQALGWTAFTVTAQLAPGIVQMRATNGTLVTLKPGSYPWGTILSS